MDKTRLEELFDEELLFEDVSLTIRRRSKNRVLKWVTSDQSVLVTIPYIFTGNYGIYVFVDDAADAPEFYRALQAKLKLKQGLFVFAMDGENGTYYDADHGNYIDFEDFYDGVATFRSNHMIPECFRHRVRFSSAEDYFDDKSELFETDGEEEEDDFGYIRPTLTDNKVDEIDDVLVAIADEPAVDGKYVYYPDGSVRVKKYVSGSFGSGGDILFPCSDADPNKMYWIAVLGGWFGAHKFIDRKWGQGILYALTCGMGGIFYLLDLISMLTGNYYFAKVDYSMGEDRRIKKSAQRFYMRPMQKRLMCAFGILAAIALTVLVIKVVYEPLLTGLSALLSALGNNLIVNNEEIISGVESVGGELGELIP